MPTRSTLIFKKILKASSVFCSPCACACSAPKRKMECVQTQINCVSTSRTRDKLPPLPQPTSTAESCLGRLHLVACTSPSQPRTSILLRCRSVLMWHSQDGIGHGLGADLLHAQGQRAVRQHRRQAAHRAVRSLRPPTSSSCCACRLPSACVASREDGRAGARARGR